MTTGRGQGLGEAERTWQTACLSVPLWLAPRRSSGQSDARVRACAFCPDDGSSLPSVPKQAPPE